jgi:DNA-binding protein HU-beta
MAAKRMTKGQMVSTMAETWGVSKRQAGEMYMDLISLAYKEIKRAGEFVMPGLGKLVKKNRPSRMGRNPATGATIKIPAKTVIKFTVAKAAKEALL